MDEDDGLNELLDKLRDADAVLLAAPTYAGACPSVMQTFLERASLVFSNSDHGLNGKVGGVIAVCGHDGASLVYNQLANFLLSNGATVCGSCPLPIIRALNSPQYQDDEKGMAGVHALVENMTSLLMRLNGFE